MKKDQTIVPIGTQEFWQPTMNLRQLEIVVSSSPYHYNKGVMLQQLFTSNLGNYEWRNVPTVTE